MESSSGKMWSFLISHHKRLLRSEFSLKSYLYLLLRKRKLEDYLIINKLKTQVCLVTFSRYMRL